MSYVFKLRANLYQKRYFKGNAKNFRKNIDEIFSELRGIFSEPIAYFTQ